MPNYVINKVEFDGDQEQINLLFDQVKCDDSPFTFKKIIPRPESLDITSGGRVDQAMAYVTYKETGNEMPLKEILNKTTYLSRQGINTIEELCSLILETGVDIEEGRKAIFNEKTYGHRDWHSWSVANWGTKWDAGDVVKDGNKIEFQTAWSTPYPVIVALSKQYPEIKISVRYADEDIGSNCGIYIIENGDLIDEQEVDGIFACNLWGYDPADYFDDYKRDQQIDKILKDGTEN